MIILFSILFFVGAISGIVLGLNSIIRTIQNKKGQTKAEISPYKRGVIIVGNVLMILALLIGIYGGVTVSRECEKQGSVQNGVQEPVSEENVPYDLYESQSVQLPTGTATYVLVPGGGHGAWCYEPVKMLLEEAEQTVYAVSLPGVGERENELTENIGLNEHIAATVEFIINNDLHDVILVGHSYGGMVITGTADKIPDRIKSIVYLDAVHPSDGQSLLDAQPLVQYVPTVSQPRIINGVEVNLYPDDETIAFLGLKEPVDIVFAKEHLTPHPWKTFTDTLHLDNPDVVSEVGKIDIYTKTTLDGLLQAGIVTEAEASAAMVIDTGHDLMITEPELTADMLLNAASKIQ